MRKKPGFGGFLLLLATLLFIIWGTRVPSNNRGWSPDQKVLSYGTFEGDLVTIYNIRNFTYRTPSDYDIRYYNKTFNLSQMKSVDYIVEPFSLYQGIAHTFYSFGFENGDYVSISVEIRKEKGEKFSATKGLVRWYELMYVIGDDRDLIKLRSNYRNDTVYLYPLKIPKEIIGAMFKDMVLKANDLTQTPQFYNTITQSCSVVSFRHLNQVSALKVPLSIKLVLPGYSDRYIYDFGLIDSNLSFEDTQRAHRIDEKARRYADDPEFSKRIRE